MPILKNYVVKARYTRNGGLLGMHTASQASADDARLTALQWAALEERNGYAMCQSASEWRGQRTDMRRGLFFRKLDVLEVRIWIEAAPVLAAYRN